jgi:hypothetical protein
MYRRNLYRPTLLYSPTDEGSPMVPTDDSIAASVGGGSTEPEPTIRVKDPIEGVEREFTASEAVKKLEEYYRSVEKVKGADKKFQEAADIRRQYEEAQKRADDLESTIIGFKNRDENAFRRMAEMLEVDRDHPGLADELWRVYSGQTNADDDSSTPESVDTSTGGGDPPMSKADAEALKFTREFFKRAQDLGIEDPAQVLALTQAFAEHGSQNQAKEMTRKALTEHKKFGRMMKSKSGSGHDKLFELVWSDVDGRVRSGQRVDEAIGEALKRAEAISDVLGSEAASGGRTPDFFRGIGQTPAAPAALHPEGSPEIDPKRLGQKEGLASEIDRVAAHYYANADDE